MFHSDIQQVWSHPVASLAGDSVGESTWGNRIRYGADRRREYWATQLQKPLGPSTATLSLLEISGHSCSQFNSWLEIEGGEAGVFVHAGRIANYGWQDALSPYWIESVQPIEIRGTMARSSAVASCEVRPKRVIRKSADCDIFIRRNPFARKS